MFVNFCSSGLVLLNRSHAFMDNIIIVGCVFSYFFVGDDHGGVISLKNSESIIFIEKSLFSCCHSAQNGGAVYTSCKESRISLVCASNCSGNWGQFGYTLAIDINECHHLSISLCRINPKGEYPICMFNGMQKCKYSNVTNNNVEVTSGVGFLSAYNSSLAYCTVTHNYASLRVVIEFAGNASVMEFTNVISNSCPGLGIVFAQLYKSSFSALSIANCIFYTNTGLLFHSYPKATMSVYDSYIIHEMNTMSGIVNINNNLFTYHPTIIINHYDCNIISETHNVHNSKTLFNHILFLQLLSS